MRVFITGATSGIGAALARHYASQGATIGLVARRLPELTQLAASLGTSTATYTADVADAEAMGKAAHDFLQRHGTPDIVIANAGISVGTLGGEAEDIPVLERVLRTNVVGLAATIQPFVGPMRAQQSGTIVGIASVAGFRGLPGSGAYSSSKSAVITWLESLRTELYGSGVHVCTLCPGYIDTPMTQGNPYPMPFKLPVEEAARRFARAIAAKKTCVVIPWQMGVVGFFLRRIPASLYPMLFARAGRKPRKLPM
jgi:short-subunit dehydrogenase